MPNTNNPHECPACSRIKGNASTTDSRGVDTCTACGCVFTTRAIYLGDSGHYVLPFMTTTPPPIEQCRPFDLTTLGSAGLQRTHGWFDPATKLVVQVG